MLTEQLNTFYSEHTTTITSFNPQYIPPSVKCMMRQKNKLMRSGRIEQAAALATKIGEAIKNFISADLSRADVIADPNTTWAQVRQLTGRSEKRRRANPELGITASILNK
jgi:predicted DNA-binding helix-hairpin-helix protein